jgi:hypothetical protein
MAQIDRKSTPRPRRLGFLPRLGRIASLALVAGTLSIAPAAARPPISQVQMEKLLRLIDVRGQNVRLNNRISDALGLGDDVIIRQATATDPVDHQAYFFATIPAAGQYLVGMQDLLGGDIFLVDTDLQLVAGVSTRGEVRKIPLPEAGKRVNDILGKFEAFLEMN